MLDEHPTQDNQNAQDVQAILAGLDQHDVLDRQGVLALRRKLLALAEQREPRISSEEQLKAESIIAFTFRPSVDACLELWFGKSSQTDIEIWQRFGEDVKLASEGAYDHWAQAPNHPRMLLALIILLDQFRRNMYRDTVGMYDTDAHCLSLIKRSIRQGAIDKLQLIERVFPCLVLTHSEELADQQLCIEEWQKVEFGLSPTDPLRVFHEVFKRHVSVIKKFGRFPHRNSLLGRESTPDEIAFLADANFRFDLPLVKRPDGSFCFQGAIKGCQVEQVKGDKTDLAYQGPDAAFALAERDIRLNGFAKVDDVKLRKFIVERDMPEIGSKKYLELKGNIDKSNRAMDGLWPRIAWVESFICNDKTYCVYLADSTKTLAAHAFMADMPIGSVNEVRTVIDPADFDRDVLIKNDLAELRQKSN